VFRTNAVGGTFGSDYEKYEEFIKIDHRLYRAETLTEQKIRDCIATATARIVNCTGSTRDRYKTRSSAIAE